MFAVIALLLVAVAGAVAAWVRWRRWRAEEQDTRLLTGIVDLRRSFRDGHVHMRLPAKGRGFTRDVETAVNRLLDEIVGHFRGRQAGTEALARALEALAEVVTRTVEQLDAAVVRVEGLGIELGRRALTTTGDAPMLDALAVLRTGDERFAGKCQTAAALADQSRSAASGCHQAFTQLRASLTELAGETAGITEGLQTLKARWTTVRTSVDDVARVAETTQVLAVSAALAAGREHEARDELDRFAAEVDEVAHGVTRGLARITGAVAACEEGMATLLGAADTGRRQLGVATDEASELDGALARIHELPSSLTELATALSGIAESQSQATTSLSAARPDASRLADELQTWTALARSVGSELARATGALTAARREAQRLLEAAP
jgi:chromosome segregation ATPase